MHRHFHRDDWFVVSSTCTSRNSGSCVATESVLVLVFSVGLILIKTKKKIAEITIPAIKPSRKTDDFPNVFFSGFYFVIYE